VIGMVMTHAARDMYIAPHMSEFTSAEIADMSNHHQEQDHWLNNYILNTIFRGRFDDEDKRQFAFNYLRRAEAAFRSYERARHLTIEYLATDYAPSAYFAALDAWEIFIANAWHSLDLIQAFSGLQKAIFTQGDGSVEERLLLVYNRSKHVDTAVNAGQVAPSSPTTVLWFTNDGLQIFESALSFGEMAEVLRDIAEWADAFVDPLETQTRVAALLDHPRVTEPDTE
jgi:hypothetical protein